MARCKKTFGGRLCPPAGFRWSPGTNAHAICVGAALAGKGGGGQAGVKQRFTAASKAC